jgi:hypothetical protein
MTFSPALVVVDQCAHTTIVCRGTGAPAARSTSYCPSAVVDKHLPLDLRYAGKYLGILCRNLRTLAAGEGTATAA